ncbi:MAG TPA: PDZ domain-containing protein [Polyangiaceae bacterium]
MGLLAAICAALVVLVGAPAAIGLGALLGWRISEGRPRVLRLVLAWLCGAVASYSFAMLWFAPPLFAAGNPEPTTQVDPISGGPAELAGVQNGDRVVKANGKRVETWDETRDTLKANPATDADELEVDRNGKLVTIRVTPVNGAIGISPRTKSGPTSVVRTSTGILLAPLTVVQATFRAVSGPRTLSGPVGVVSTSVWPWSLVFVSAGTWSSLLGCLLVGVSILVLPIAIRMLERRAAKQANPPA